MKSLVFSREIVGSNQFFFFVIYFDADSTLVYEYNIYLWDGPGLKRMTSPITREWAPSYNNDINIHNFVTVWEWHHIYPSLVKVLGSYECLEFVYGFIGSRQEVMSIPRKNRREKEIKRCMLCMGTRTVTTSYGEVHPYPSPF